MPNTEPLLERAPLIRQVMGVQITGSGSCAGKNRVANEDLTGIGCDPDWIVQRTGIRARRHVSPGQATSDLALEAARRCLQDAGASPEEVDFIVVATMTGDHFTPSSAALVQAALGCHCPAVDINAACSGFMYALVIGSQLVKTGCYRKVLLIGADVMSIVVDPLDRKTYPLFGDGAGAVLLEGDPVSSDREQQGLLGFRLASEGELSHLLVVPGGGSRMPVSEEVVRTRSQYLKMEGPSVFKWAVRLIPEVARELLHSANLELEDIDLFILHQANRRIIDSAIEHLGVPPEKVFVNVEEYGNTSAASIAISLDEARRAGRIHPGDRVLLCGFGAGLSWGGCIFQF